MNKTLYNHIASKLTKNGVLNRTRLVVMIPKEVLSEFKARCDKLGQPMTKVLIKLIEEFNRG